MKLPGFDLAQDAVVAETHALVRARRRTDGAAVLLIGPPRLPPGPDHDDQLRRQRALRADLSLPGVLPARELVVLDGATWLLLDDPGATPLPLAGPLDLAAALHLLASLAGILADLHRRDVIHHNVQPASILVDPATRRVWLDGFALATRGGDAAPTARGALAYTSPELTGRMNRAVDHRSDLYALGVVAYELVAGRRPYTSSDPLELIHAHLAKSPAPLDGGVPEPVARIILRLLEKSADARYQSAAGLRADLERCARELAARGEIAPFELGAHDVVDRFLAPQRLYGREREVEALTRAFEQATAGPSALALVAGYSGIGKTSLIHELYRPIVRQRGAFISGKFDQVARNVPYGALLQAFRALTQTLLTEPEERLAEHRARLLDALGCNGAVLSDVIPEIALIIGEQPPVPRLAPAEAQNRFRLVIQGFVGALARRDHPLVLFLDDLQWADPASLSLLEPLLTSPDVRHLLVIGAYRDNEVDAAHLLARIVVSLEASGGRVERIVLGPLALPALGRLIGDLLRRHDPEVAALAELVAVKTEGNPFFVLQFLKTLSQDGLLTFDDEAGRWSFRLDAIAGASMTGNVIDLMARRIARLSPRAQEVLTLAACIGNPFDLATLALVGGTPEAETAALVDEALEEGLLLRGAAPGELGFLHDRVQQAAYVRLPEERRRALHLAAGRVLLARWDRAEERIFDVVGHLDRGRALIVDPEERREVALLERQAGRRAKTSAAYQAALGYFSAALELLGPDAWETDHELCFELGREVAEHESLCGRFAEAERRFAELLARARSPLEAAQVHDQRLLMHENRSRFDEAARIGLEGLRLLGCTFPDDDAARRAALDDELAAIAALRGDRPIAALVDLPLLADPETRLVMRLLTDSWAPAYVAWGALLPSLISARMVRLSIEHGHCEDSAYGYVTHAITVGPTRGDYAAAYEWGTLALAVNERLDDVKLRAKVHQQFNAHVTLWRRPLESCAVHAREACRSGVANGDFVYAGYGAFTESWPAFLCSRDLERFVRELTPNVALLERIHTTGLADALRVMLDWARALKGRPAELDEAAFAAAHGDNPFFMTILWTSRLHRALLGGDARAAVDASRQARRGWGHGTIFPVLADAWGGLARATLLDDAPAEERAALRAELDTSAASLRLLAENCVENYGVWSLLLDGERARLDGDCAAAVPRFEEAIRLARRSGSVQHEALAHDRAARLWLARGAELVAEVHLGEARRCLRAWGATAMVHRLDELHPRLRWRADDAAGASLDVESVTRAARALSVEIVQSELVRTLLRLAVENAGAGRGVFLADDGEVEADLGGPVPPERRAGIARSVVQYVKKTGQSLVLSDAAADERFAADPYVQAARPRSILCMPVVHQGQSGGILYLENNLAADAFTAERIRVLQVLSAQAAISLENARLYREKSEEVERRRRAEEELRGALAEVESLKNRLEAENVYLQEEIRSEHNFEEMVGQSPALRAALRTVERVAPTESTVLITGETGVGKELIARAIHDRSRRRDRPLVKVNCGAIAAGLVESELFGHVKGAFTGALERRIGRFELAQGGTIFLDEIGEVPLETQVKLLRVLQEQELEPVGSSKTLRVDVRVIAATNRDLDADVRTGKFRSDLFYRLNVLPVTVPPLRERRSDIPQLVAFFVGRFARRLSKTVTSVSRDTMELLVAYDWPGNVRELQNVIERAVVLASGSTLVLDRDLLPASLAHAAARPVARASASPPPFAEATPAGGLTLEDVERRHIMEVLARTRGVIEGPAGAAKILDLHPNTLRSRMKKLGITRGGPGHEMS